MPRTTTAPPSDRFFARLDKFECECPHCGKLIYTAMDRRAHTVRQQTLSKRMAVRLTPESRRLYDSVWNPCTQRLKCPSCGKVYMAGLLLFSVPPGLKNIIDPPPDVLPDAREVAQSRQKAGGWHAARPRQRGEPVNVVVTTPCSCPHPGWSAGCAVHGDPVQLGPSAV
jgi:uncharacterized C2H2 Zn-finger protein